MYENLPDEIVFAQKIYTEDYAQIRDEINANKEKYKGTIYEDCPPMTERHTQFMVRHRDVTRIREHLTQKYGHCPSHWAYWVAYAEKKKTLD